MNANTPTIKRDMLISLRTFKEEDGSYGVECLVSGLLNEQQAERALDFVQDAICGKEMSIN